MNSPRDLHRASKGIDGRATLAGIRDLFPALTQDVHGKPLVYLDNAASTQKPRAVIDALVRFYEMDNSNVHRGAHALSDRATAAYERARETARRFLNAREAGEIVFVRGATEAINLVSQTFGRQHVGTGDEVVVTELEHHANLVPWQQLCREKGAVLRVVPITDRGEIRLDALESVLNPRTKLVAVSHVSNALGTVNPVKEVIAAAHRWSVPVLVDGAQAAPHVHVDVQDLDCDFYAFSGHKVYGPMGIGVLYGKAERLASMPPWQFGGDMVETVGFDETTFNEAPYRFEAGTPNVAGAVGLATALEFLEGFGRDEVAAHESELLELALKRLSEIPGLRIVGEPNERAGVISFSVEDPPMSALDVAARLDAEGIAVRAGNHCCMPLMGRLGIPGTVRASFGLYNNADDVERLAFAVREITSGTTKVRTGSGHRALTEKGSGPSGSSEQVETVDMVAATLLDDFDAMEDWAERYEFLIDLGRRAPALSDDLKTDANRVRGCQSTVYMATSVKPGSPDVIEFAADSDSELVKGLLALLHRLFSGHRAADVLAFDLPRFLEMAGLNSNLTTGRRNGLAAMIKRLRGFAAGCQVANPQFDPRHSSVTQHLAAGRRD